MTKKLFFMMILAVAGITAASAQVRIGGIEVPDKSAVLDLNPDNDTLSGNATLGLALPRVNLRNADDAFPLSSHVKGMVVYNMATTGNIIPGIYINDGKRWLRQLDSHTLPVDSILQYVTGNLLNTVFADSIINLIHENERDGDGVIGNEVTDATQGGGLIRSGAGTAASPYTLGIASGGVTGLHIAGDAVNSTKISDKAVTSAKIADGTITNANISSTAAIDLDKIALPSASANNGKVLKSNGTSWIAGDDVNTDTNTTYTAGSGLTLSGTTFAIGAGQVNNAMIADNAINSTKISDNAVTSAKIANGTILAEDLNSMSASSGQVLTYNGSAWAPTTKYSTPIMISSTATVAGSISSGSYSDLYVWSNLPAGLYSVRLRMDVNGTAKFLLSSDVPFGTSVPFEVTSDSHDNTAEVMFNFVYSGTLRLRAMCTGGCPSRLVNLTLSHF